MPTISINAPTKINLRLKVIGRRADGYHILSMLNEKLLLSDTIEVTSEGELGPATPNFSVKIECQKVPALANESNLVVKAARRLAAKYNVSTPLHIRIDKNIPIGAGLGGGSSDAAATIKALNRIWGLNKSDKELAEFGVTIGADLPFFFSEGPALVRGIGEDVNSDVLLPKLWVLLVNPGFEVSTKWVYESLGLKLTEMGENDRFRPFFNNLDELEKLVENDLEQVVKKKHPEINEIKNFLTGIGARIVFMSGSGPTVVGLFENKESRDAALQNSKHKAWKFFATENIWHRR